jgi:peptidoglycan hydrolase CwlO-like protein
MQVNSSTEETQISTLLLGTATNILNHVSNLQEELKATREIAADLQGKLKERDSKIHTLEKEIEDLTIQLGKLELQQ